LDYSHFFRDFIQTWYYLLHSLCGTVVIALNCLHPFVPENGYVTFDVPAPYIPSTIAKYSCAAGFDSIGGTDRRACTSSGRWTGEAPTCAIDVAAGKPATQAST
uniref:Sushi domain-containing protein n=1 Tax=Angiostrongylus cantonensis TaxID=6313 RepID=A0A0K0DA97_ANGCA